VKNLMNNPIKITQNFVWPEIDKENILLEYWSDDWNRYMPVSIIKYDDGTMDLHCQDGDHHIKAVKEAKKILHQQNYKVKKCVVIGQSGLYYPMVRGFVSIIAKSKFKQSA